MEIRPQEFEVSEELLRERLNLPVNAIVFPFGYEGLVDNSIILMLKQRYDATSLFFRTRPDYMVLDAPALYLVEAKQRTKNVEAVQLFFNKCLERMGIKVVYSFPELSIRASLIPMEVVIVPANYSKEFDKHLIQLFAGEYNPEFSYVGQVSGGSGDAFVPIDVDDLKILSECNL